jgi:ubiquitin-like domain-containing CTD phosphatase 1
VNDFDVGDEFVLDVKDNEENHKKIQNRINSYEAKILNPPRKDKKLLVLDIDYTIFDHRSTVDNVFILKRPYLDEFLEAVYEFYDIIIWSATSMKWIEAKMTEIGVLSNPKCKITALFDKGAMITVNDPKYGVIDIKPLAVIWGKFPQYYNAKNTIMVDDLRRNFLMNPENGLKIRPFCHAQLARETDKELLYLKEYLLLIAKLDNFSNVNHRHWRSYIHLAE